MKSVLSLPDRLFFLQVRRSLKIRGRRKEKEKLPSGITADYTAAFLASLDRDLQPPDSPNPNNGSMNSAQSSNTWLSRTEVQTQSDSSEASLNSLNKQYLPPVPPRPPKRGILKSPRVSTISNGSSNDNLMRNTLQNEVIAYQNLPQQNLLMITSPSQDSLTESTNSSFATPPFSLSPVGESQGFHRWTRTANFDDMHLPLPNIVPLVLPKPRTLTIQRQPAPRSDFGFSLRRAMIVERGNVSGVVSSVGGVSDLVVPTSGGVVMKAVIFAEPGAIVQNNNETGLLPGDRLLEVNAVNVDDKTREEIIDLIKGSKDYVTVKVRLYNIFLVLKY